jgi:hypothetical protein
MLQEIITCLIAASGRNKPHISTTKKIGTLRKEGTENNKHLRESEPNFGQTN